MGTGSAGPIEFRVLGTLEVSRRGELLPLGGERQRALLALLLVHANELIATEQLMELLFGEGRPNDARNALRVAISRLRRALQGTADAPVIQTRPGGYVLRAGPGQRDVARFEALFEEGRALISAGDVVGGAGRLRDALGLWRGAPLADLANVEYLQADIRRLEGLRSLAVMERIDADLALGAGAELIAELETLVAGEPLQARLRGQLMLALYRAGRQTDALASYRDVSQLLRDELGLEPSQALQELELSILRQDESLERPPQAASARAGNLPVAATPFIGRVRELAELMALVSRADRRLLTLTGAGGSGKTRLALRVAEMCAGAYRDGGWFCELRRYHRP